ncbi:MAG TPA: hypothetical protein PLG47_04935 [Candidatus Dojkabacteria bacterium]|nr:hypothetical protein [Candidatus Dojkabacteria bacterium]
MIAKLFDIQNGKIVPTEHCYTIGWLKDIMDEYKENKEYLKVYMYLFYMTYPSPDVNPYFHIKDSEKEELILEDIKANFSVEDELVVLGLMKIKKMYETPTSRAYEGIAGMLDKLAKYMKTTDITDGRDGNITSLVTAAKNFEQVRASFKGAFKDLQEEQESRVRGGKGLGYDQM